jgi:hypothetical protein
MCAAANFPLPGASPFRQCLEDSAPQGPFEPVPLTIPTGFLDITGAGGGAWVVLRNILTSRRLLYDMAEWAQRFDPALFSGLCEG